MPSSTDLHDLPDTLTAGEVAPILRIPKLQVYKLCREGVIPHRRLGHLVRIPRDEFLRWLGVETEERPSTKRVYEAIP